MAKKESGYLRFIKPMQDAYEQNLKKLATFEVGDRVTKPWVSFNTGKQSKVHGVFVSRTTGTNCLVLWDTNVDGEPQEETISFIDHAS